MSRTGRVVGVTAGAVAAAAVGGAARTAYAVTRRRRGMDSRPADATPFGSLHSTPHTVMTSDGVPLHVEVDEPEAIDHELGHSPVTIVFVHGFTLNLDSWHFQRAAFRGLVRTVFYDQRGHGRSGRPADGDLASTGVDRLAQDLLEVIDAVASDGPIVLVGHSMGGMTVIAFGEQHPELLAPLDEGGRIVGAALISTTAGGLDPARMLLPLVPAKLTSGLTHTAVRTLARGHKAVDGVRRLGSAVATVVTDAFAFGDDVPTSYVEFADQMIASTPFEVVAQFFPHFRGLDKFDDIEVFGRIPTTIICGTDDKLTSIGHSRKLHVQIPGSRLVECEGAGHLVVLERHGQVDAALDQLLAAASAGSTGSRPR